MRVCGEANVETTHSDVLFILMLVLVFVATMLPDRNRSTEAETTASDGGALSRCG